MPRAALRRFTPACEHCGERLMQFATNTGVHCAESRNRWRDLQRTLSMSHGTLAAPHDAFMEDAMTAQHAHYAPLGTIETDAPVPALLAALQTLRPALHIRLVPIGGSERPRYRVEAEPNRLPDEEKSIDTWLHVKSALM